MPATCFLLTRILNSFLHVNKHFNSCRTPVRHFNTIVQYPPRSKKEQVVIRPCITRLKTISFNWHFTSRHEPLGHVQAYLADPFNILHYKYKTKYKNRRRDTLWWTAQVGMGTSHKSCVRNYCSRRLKEAFIKALEIRGFHRDGRILASEKYPNGQDGILGSARFSCIKPMITIDSAALDEECLAVLDHIILLNARLNKKKNGKTYTASSSMPYRSNLTL